VEGRNEIMKFADKVRDLLKLHRMSQSDLAAALGTNQPQVSRWLESDTPPKWDYLLKMSRALGVPADYLIDPEQDAPPPSPELSDDERFVLQLYRDLRLSRDEAVRRLASAGASAPASASGVPWIPGAVRDLTPSEFARQRERGRGAKRRSKPEPDGQDEGTDTEYPPSRVR
jgi:transcriptional regulator with XRE-family HTH domain